MSKELRLTPMQRDFIKRFVANGGNATHAARDAGYKQPNKVGFQVAQLPHVKAEIARLGAKAAARVERKTIMDGEELQTHLTTIIRNTKERTKDRIAAATTLGRILGLFQDKREYNLNVLAGVVILPANGREPAPEQAGVIEMLPSDTGPGSPH